MLERSEYGLLDSYLDGIPIFAREGVLRSLFEPFLAFGKAFIPMTDVSMDRIIKSWCLCIASRSLTFQQP